MKTTIKALLLFFTAFYFAGCQIAATAKPGESQPGQAENENVRWGLPGTDGKLLTRSAYVLLYDSGKKEPLWVSYHLTRERLKGKEKRNDKFIPDPDLPAGERPELSDYRNSGYDRGHMSPAADNTFSPLAMKECFYLSNMVPQKHSLNNGKWKELETRIREFTKSNGESWIICGPIFQRTESEALKKAGSVWVPTHCYKLVAFREGSGLSAVGFVMRNDNEKAELKNYVRKIEDIEALTGLDFLDRLQDSEEARIEKAVPVNSGFFGQ